MSVVRCDGCNNQIDTDFDVEAYNEAANRWWCKTCREVPADPSPAERRLEAMGDEKR